MQDISIIGIIVAVVVLVILLFMAIGYVKAPPDMAYIISGVKKKSKVVIGKARAIIKCLKLTVTVIGNCITIGWCISISLRINSDSYCLSVRLSTVTVFCTGIILSYPFEITDSMDWVHF